MPGHQGPMPNATTIVTRVKQQLGGLLWLNAKVSKCLYASFAYTSNLH